MSTSTPSVQRRILASELRRLRLTHGMTQAEAGAASHLSHDAISRYEGGGSTPGVNDVRQLLTTYGVQGDRLDELLDLARQARRRGRLRGVQGTVWPPLENLIALERDASSIQELALVAVPGVLQTERYSRAVLAAGDLGADVDQHVKARMARAAAMFDRAEPPRYWVVMRESVLDSAVGGAEVMAEQLDHLAAMAHQRHITVQVIPNSHGAHPSMSGWFSLMRFDIAPEFGVVYTDYLTGSVYRDEPDEVARYADAFERLVAAALPAAQSVEMITRARDAYRT
ncbi:MAG TPA: helix-turn-helix transcriptional regulator [Nocardioidaceae bacterium]